jgi:hypothetical protein
MRGLQALLVLIEIMRYIVATTTGAALASRVVKPNVPTFFAFVFHTRHVNTPQKRVCYSDGNGLY